MKYRDLNIQTLREAPNNARTEGFAFLVRAGYLTRENQPTQLGNYTIQRLRKAPDGPSFLSQLSLGTLQSKIEVFFPLPSGSTEVAHCPSCTYAERLELAQFQKRVGASEPLLALEKVFTPECHTIEALAAFLGVPREGTAKALMFTRLSDNRFVFVLVRGDMQLSEAKLRQHIGDFRLATAEEIQRSGAAAGYASPIGLLDTLVVVDDLIPGSPNLVTGANEVGYHFRNTNYGRDYSAQMVEDLVRASPGDPCKICGNPLSILSAMVLATRNQLDLQNLLLALAEAHHDARGLTIPPSAAPFEVYLMHIPGKEIDTLSQTEQIYGTLQKAGIRVLFDDREERAGVKFNDADLIGCPMRVTVGEKALKAGMVECKPRKEKENTLIPIEQLTVYLQDRSGWVPQ